MASASGRFSDFDQQCMLRALALAERGRGWVEPNPLVGCVLTRRGRVLAEGLHRRFGGPHAEADALARCAHRARGATAYVTLEPCAHHGKTPPCADALAAAGVARVVTAMTDPFPAVSGRGIRRLRAAGVHVDVGLCRSEAQRLNAPYLSLVKRGRPYVILKWAQSLDGKIATHTGESKWITGEAARREGHRLRSRVDAIIVGIGTVLADNPMLTCRAVQPKRIATRVVLDGRLRMPPGSAIVRTAKSVPTLLVTTTQSIRSAARRARSLERAGCALLALRAHKGRIDLAMLLDEMGRQRWTNVLVEGGGRVLGAFVDAGLADEAYAFVAPRLIGGAGAPGPLGGIGVVELRDTEPATLLELRSVGRDRLYHFLFSEVPK